VNIKNSEMDSPHPLPGNKRPFFLTILCLFSGVYFFLFTILFLSGFFYSGWVTDAINLYAPIDQYSLTAVRLVLGVFAALFILGLSGIIIMWNLRKTGYYLFGISSLILASSQFLVSRISFSGALVLIPLLILFGFYFRRFT